jgi:hypothetical protein
VREETKLSRALVTLLLYLHRIDMLDFQAASSSTNTQQTQISLHYLAANFIKQE